MTNYNTLSGTPLENINHSFKTYVEQKKAFNAKHMDGNGIPDYAYKMDLEHRKKLDAMPGVFKLAKTVSSTYVPSEIQRCMMSGIKVGPNQYPEIYKMARDCADILGIGIPTVLVIPSSGGDDFNAYTLASDDVDPVVVITGMMAERMSAEELKGIIGHECGHIHNNHTVYSILERVILTMGLSALINIPGVAQSAQFIGTGMEIALAHWSRAAEVSADRAALICCGNLEVMQNALGKLMYNGADLSNSVNSKLNIDEIKRQMHEVINSPYRLYELVNDHPLTTKRIIGITDFMECKTYYDWRPDLANPSIKLYTKAETDAKCKAYFDVVDPKEKGAKKK